MTGSFRLRTLRDKDLGANMSECVLLYMAAVQQLLNRTLRCGVDLLPKISTTAFQG